MARRYQIAGGLSLRGRNLISIAWLLNAACSFLSGLAQAVGGVWAEVWAELRCSLKWPFLHAQEALKSRLMAGFSVTASACF